MPKPIEMHAHDPLRYCGDMLAWLHQVRSCDVLMMERLIPLGGSVGLSSGHQKFESDTPSKFQLSGSSVLRPAKSSCRL